MSIQKQMTTPMVTIGLPVRNGGAHLREALNSLLAQEFKDFSIYISDNVSDDETGAVCREFEQNDERVHYERRGSEVAVFDNFFDLVDKCESEFFMWAAHDDLWSKNWILLLVSILRKQERAIGAFGALIHVDCNGRDMLLHPANGVTFEKWSNPQKTKRYLSYLHSNSSKGKANLLYSLFRTSALKQAIGTARQRGVDYDCAILSGILWDGYIASTASATFSKRICLNSSNDARPSDHHRGVSDIPLSLRIRRRVQRAIDSHDELVQYVSMSRGFHARVMTVFHYIVQVFGIMFSFLNVISDFRSLYVNRKA